MSSHRQLLLAVIMATTTTSSALELMQLRVSMQTTSAPQRCAVLSASADDTFVPKPNEDFLDFERECFKGEEECELIWGEYAGATAGDEEVWGARKAEGEAIIARRAQLAAEEEAARARLKAMLDAGGAS